MATMVWLLAVLFLVVPFVELAVIVASAQQIGLVPTLGLLVAVSIAGGYLVKREGLGVVRRTQEQLGAGELPAKELVDGALIVLAGALLLTPGFLSDVLGIILLLPPTRAAVRALALHRVRRRLLSTVGPLGSPVWHDPGPVLDVDEVVPRHHQAERLSRPALGER